jgi:hypothetical protein
MMDDAGGMVGGVAGGAMGLWLLQRVFTRFLDGGEKAEALGPKLDAVITSLSDVKKTLEKIDRSVDSHETDITVLKGAVGRLEGEKHEAHGKMWARLDEVSKRVAGIELAQASKRGRGR